MTTQLLLELLAVTHSNILFSATQMKEKIGKAVVAVAIVAIMKNKGDDVNSLQYI